MNPAPKGTLNLLVTALLLAGIVAWAGPARRRADRNQDGTVDRHERREARERLQEKAQVDKRWEEKADRNDDGVVGRGEARSFWRHQRSKVNTEVEKKYDADGDGTLDPAEARKMLKDRWLLVKTDGKAKVDTDLEKAYDTNGDGLISPDEAVALKSDLDAE